MMASAVGPQDGWLAKRSPAARVAIRPRNGFARNGSPNRAGERGGEWGAAAASVMAASMAGASSLLVDTPVQQPGVGDATARARTPIAGAPPGWSARRAASRTGTLPDLPGPQDAALTFPSRWASARSRMFTIGSDRGMNPVSAGPWMTATSSSSSSSPVAERCKDTADAAHAETVQFGGEARPCWHCRRRRSPATRPTGFPCARRKAPQK